MSMETDNGSAKISEVTGRRGGGEAALPESEERLRFALGAACVGVWDWNIVTGDVTWSPEHERLFGMEPGSFQGVHERFLSRLHPEDRDRVVAVTREAVERGSDYDDEFRVVWPDGSIHWIVGKGKVFYDSSGQPLRMSGIVTDITERKQAEEALKKSEMLREEAQALAHLGTWDWDIVTDTVTWSDEMYRIFGVEPQAFPGTIEGVRRHIHPEDRRILPQVIAQARRNQAPSEYYHRIVWPDGTVRTVHARAVVVTDNTGKPIRMYGAVEDVTERKQAEEALQEKINRLQLLKTLHETFQGALDLTTVFQRLYELLPRYLGVDRATVLMYDSQRDALITDLLIGVERRDEPSSAHPQTLTSISGQCFRQGRFIVVEDCTGTDIIPARWVEALRLKSTMALPLIRDSAVTGVLRLDYTERFHHFSPGEIEFLQLVTEQIGIVVHNAHLHTERQRVENALREAEEKYRTIFENTMEGIYQTTPEGRILSANPALARICGYDSPGDLISSISDIERQVYVDPQRRGEFLERLREQGAVSNFESQIFGKDGSVLWVSENARAVRDAAGDIVYFEGTIEDISHRKAVEEQLVHDAFHDQLTGLPNRALFEDRLAHLIDRQRRREGHPFAVLFLDFDRFKVINDSLGHMVGDHLLVAVGRRLTETLRPGDTIARFGGDEFAILLEEMLEVGDATQAADRIQTALAGPLEVGGHTIFLTVSIGIALSTPAYERPEDLLRDADMAMYRAKGQGRAGYAVFDTTMHEQAVVRLQLETDLRWAIERGEMRVYYQSIVSLASGRIAGLEALARWQHPTRGLVLPEAFIPAAEETGLIVSIDRWVLEAAARQVQDWRARFPQHHALGVSANISSKQFSQPNLPGIIDHILHHSGRDAGYLSLETTESVIMENADSAAQILTDLRGRGIQVAMDDFGTGYSSLSGLRRFPITVLKIDRSFIHRGEDPEIVRAIVTMAQSLHIAVVAEGVETAEHLALLRSLGCEYGQGFFFSEPLDAEAMETLLARDPRW